MWGSQSQRQRRPCGKPVCWTCELRVVRKWSNALVHRGSEYTPTSVSQQRLDITHTTSNTSTCNSTK